MIRTLAFAMAAILVSGTALAETHPPTTAPGQPPTDMDMPVSPHQEQTYRQIEKHGPRFQALDQDGDGFISVEEARANPELSGQFKQFDENGDGKLDLTEFAKFEQGATAP